MVKHSIMWFVFQVVKRTHFYFRRTFSS
ncbi:uncharacterized protein CELE_ZK180.8 [Caenorhabditis elegans]|uniref:Uncharacterized protein n=1 Tax=Caenorhabditis elegans TaxID=6239 RepID=D3YT09_CAEEL|nr:Uncharacterized protein CELE_ZK180.8 [Caenorhabditis elegans]CCD73080.1 Uncharacterized protein CELE_ZK180.8 [Caenorhabditis elegans]|eukprot:NP_001255263.1 Uncharacterized protein CELE_ZK180.8 [Caenorhabditis elegans]